MTSMIQTLASRGNLAALAVMDAFNPDQERDEKGMWTSSGGGGESASTASHHEAAVKYHESSANSARASGNHHVASLHEAARQAHVDSLHKEQGRAHLLMSNSRKSQEELRAEARAASSRANAASSSSSRTMTELPAIKETPSKQLAMSQRVPASSSPGKDKPVMGSDPNRVTQKEMTTVESVSKADIAKWAEHANLIGQAHQHEREAAQHEFMGRTTEAAKSKLSAARARARAQELDAPKSKRLGETTSRGSKSSRQEAAAAAAGRWASKALSVKQGTTAGSKNEVGKGFTLDLTRGPTIRSSGKMPRR